MIEMLVTQCISLAWFRCLMEEGFDFVNKQTGEIETNEVTIYRKLHAGSGEFDMPAAKCSPKGLEKNLLEVIGNLVVYNTNLSVKEALNTSQFTDAIKQHIEKVRAREYSGKLPS
jgi:hypothetical protein